MAHNKNEKFLKIKIKLAQFFWLTV